MIVFKTLKYKNFLSSGNVATTIELNKAPSTLVVGTNGAGKSTMLDAISFALFGRPFRKVSKTQLINSINGREMAVEIEFQLGKHEYKILRGLKPSIFEVYRDGVMINQDADVREYQDMLERTILKLNHKSFSQIVILGSASFVPFMQLPAAHRREVIEDLLDIQIFSVMNNILKDRVNINKARLTDNDYQVEMKMQKIDTIEDHIKVLKGANTRLIDDREQKIAEVQAQLDRHLGDLKVVQKELKDKNASISDKQNVATKLQELLTLERKLEDKKKRLKKENEFFAHNDNCPTCKQSIDEGFKTGHVHSNDQTIGEVETALARLEADVQVASDRTTEIKAVEKEIRELDIRKVAIDTHITNCRNLLNELGQEVVTISTNTSDIDQAEADLQAVKDELKLLAKESERLSNERQLLDVAGALLKDSGIKTKIIKQYVPVMNKLINKYLAAMDFFVNFELNENFEETIKSRFRDEFSYDSFSEGEKLRIDLALLFTWRAIAKLRNSVNTNLLIMDEVFDSSLDSGGTEEFLKILANTVHDTNVFIISHRTDNLFDKFHSVIKFQKHNNFSRIEQ
jgi:DNA repair exonuclease SbcCD ATPase subunit